MHNCGFFKVYGIIPKWDILACYRFSICMLLALRAHETENSSTQFCHMLASFCCNHKLNTTRINITDYKNKFIFLFLAFFDQLFQNHLICDLELDSSVPKKEFLMIITRWVYCLAKKWLESAMKHVRVKSNW